MTHLHPLRDKCLSAFGNYAHEAQKTCGLLGKLEDSSVTLDRLLAILAQTQVEDQAQEAYQLLRHQLFEVLGDRILKPLDRDQTKPLRPFNNKRNLKGIARGSGLV